MSAACAALLLVAIIVVDSEEGRDLENFPSAVITN